MDNRFIMLTNYETRKVILVGDAGVGKTSILTKYLNPDSDLSNLVGTVPSSYEKITIKNDNGEQIELQVWDTAGQERFRSLIQLYMHDVQIAFVCFDYNTIESTKIIDWCKLILNYSPESLIFLIATKIDLCQTNEEIMNIQKYMDNAKKAYNKITALFMTSGKSGYGLDDLFYSAANYKIPKNNNDNPHITLGQDSNLNNNNKDKKECC